MKSLFTTIEFVCMNTATTGGIFLLRYNRMKHLVVDDVFEKPRRNKRCIEEWMNPDDPVLFLNGTKNELLSRSMFSPPSPAHFVAAKTLSKMPLV